MGRFVARARRGLADDVSLSHPLESWFVGVGEALFVGGDGSVAGSVVGRRLAREGVDLGEALDGLRAAARAITGRDPSFATVRALSVAWSDEVQGYIHAVRCVDPATGLATGAHLQERVREALADDEDGFTEPWCVVVVDAPSVLDDGTLDGTWRMVQLAERMRWVFPGATIARLRTGRIAVLSRRTTDLGARVSDLRGLVNAGLPEPSRVWIEGLPAEVSSASRVVDELLRA